MRKILKKMAHNRKESTIGFYLKQTKKTNFLSEKTGGIKIWVVLWGFFFLFYSLKNE